MRWFNMTKEAYAEYVKQKSPNSKTLRDTFRAFLMGGLICCVGQLFTELYLYFGIAAELGSSCTSITMVFLGALLTGLGIYDNLAKFGGAGTLVPITGFANAVVSPALEFKTEGLVTGTGAKMFVISGPVIVYGVSVSIIYGVILWIFGMLT